jgi:hypothetical protein
MVTVTASTVPRIGDPVDDHSLGKEHLEIWAKATGGGSAFTFGEVLCLPPGATIAVAATTGAVGRFGVVVRLGDNYEATTGAGHMNTDTSNQVLVGTNGGRYYVKGTGAIKWNSEVQAASTGLIAQFVPATYTTTTPANFTGPATEFERIVGIYEGHYKESLQSGGEPPTDATTGQENLILRVSGRYSQ